MNADPKTIGPYVIRGERFAEGGTAELYRAQRGGTGPIVCVKRMRRGDELDEDFVAAFAAEADLAIKLRHPNIVRVHEWGEDAGRYYLAMELVDGPDLGTLLGIHERVPPEVVAHIGASLARALIFSHHRDEDADRAPLIHCDLTPHNVLIDGSGAVKLGDFGLARALKTTGAATLTRSEGKAGYLAPEQLDPDSLITSRVDLFALGLVLWRALIGTHPYVERCPPGHSLRRWIPAQLRDCARSRRGVIEAAPVAPAGLCDAIERLLQPLPARTATAERVLAVLEPHVLPTSAAMLGRLVAATARSRVASERGDEH